MSIAFEVPLLPDQPERLGRLRNLAGLVGLVGLAVALVPALMSGGWSRMALLAYLVGFIFWMGVVLGCLGLTMLHHLTGGSWGIAIRRPLEAGAMAIIPMAVLFLPIALGLGSIYRWMDHEFAHHHAAVRHKLNYLNTGAWSARAILYFVLWITFALMLSGWSRQQDKTRNLAPTNRLRFISGPGMVLMFLTVTFSSVDWIMSLEPDWYSTIYGVMLLVGWAVTTLSVMVLAVTMLAGVFEPMARVVTPGRLQDIGNLMLAFTMLWAYMSFMQYFIIWCGNLTEEIPYYLRRTRGGWEFFGIALVAFHFFSPFFMLLMRNIKRNLRWMQGVAILIIFMHMLDMIWLILPSQFEDPLSPKIHIDWLQMLLAFVSIIGVGGIFVATFAWQLSRKPMSLVNDPAVLNALAHGEKPWGFGFEHDSYTRG